MKRIGCLLLALVLLFLAPLSGVQVTEAQTVTYSKMKDCVEYSSIHYICPGSKDFQKVPLFTVKDGVEIGLTPVDNKPYISTVGLESVTQSGIWQEMVEIDFMTGELSYVGSRDAKSLEGERVTVVATLFANTGERMEIKSTVYFVEDRFQIFFPVSGPYLPGDSIPAELFCGSHGVNSVRWESSDPSVVKVTGDGIKNAELSLLKTGTATITATVKTNDTSEVVKKEITVNWVPEKPTLNFSKISMYAGESISLSCNNLSQKAKVTFASGNPKVATVSGKGGKITAVGKGSTEITVLVSEPDSRYKKATKYKLKCKVSVTDSQKVTQIKSWSQLQKALTGKGGVYRLCSNISNVDNGIKVSTGSHRLDLNGYTISGKGSSKLDSGLIDVTGGSLVLLDSKGKGKIKNTYSQEAIGCMKGKLVVYGGTYEGINYAMYNEGGTTIVYGGKFRCPGAAVKLIGGTANIYGGTFENYESEWNTPEKETSIVVRGNTKELNIYGGNFKGSSGITSYSETAIIRIYSGNYDTTDSCLDLSNGVTYVYGGDFHSENVTVSVGPFFGQVTLFVHGGSFTSKEKEVVWVQNKAYVTIDGGWFSTGNENDSTLVYIIKTLSGKVDISESVISPNDINDETPEGQHLIATKFKRNKTKYKKGMTVTKPNDLYSAFMDAYENLYTHIEIYCSKELSDVLNHYYEDWRELRSYHEMNSFFDIADDKKYSANDGMYLCTFDVVYSVNYELDRISVKPSLLKKASKDAQKYSTMIDKIISSCTKSDMTKLQKAKALHDYMVKQYTYDYTFADESYTVQGLLENHTGVCQAYALLYKSLCRRVGIECYTIEGVAGNPAELHMWNCVVIDKKQLFVDVTFDDTAGTNQWCLKDEKTFYSDGLHY